jgi:CrcB protein
MTWTLALSVAAGGAIGAPLRYLIDSRVSRASQERGDGLFPWGLLVVNVLGSFIIGVAYVTLEGPGRALIATGACGALTTYSSYALFVNRVWDEDRAAAWKAIIVMPVACIGAAGIAVFITRALTGY